MKILKVIHGYPMRYNAGSEVYSQTLCRALADEKHKIEIFTREENSFETDFALHQECDALDSRITLNIINIPSERYRNKYCISEVNQKFANVLDRFKPDIIHIGHLNHLSLSMLSVAEKNNIPMVYTLHDYWLMCPRGQFIQRNSKEKEISPLCDRQIDERCARNCYAGYFSGISEHEEEEIYYWTRWISHRMSKIHEMIDKISLFIAPSHYLRNKFIKEFGLPENKVIYQDYGFDLNRLQGHKSNKNKPFTFGYIGTHIPAKGIQHLLEAFTMLSGQSHLKIWGRARGEHTNPLKKSVDLLPLEIQKRIKWPGEYQNEDIVQDVFNEVDAIVIPSIWYENSPLVIHEAQQIGVPVITADIGGMSEYVHHEVNGLLFKHRNPTSLAQQMQRFVDNPSWSQKLGERRYLYSKTGDIPCIKTQAKNFTTLYQNIIRERGA